jgi:hypothetical protein
MSSDKITGMSPIYTPAPASPKAAPEPPADQDIALAVIAEMHKRREMGIARYGKPVRAHEPGEDWLWHSIEEKMDDLVYTWAEWEKRKQEKSTMSHEPETIPHLSDEEWERKQKVRKAVREAFEPAPAATTEPLPTSPPAPPQEPTVMKWAPISCIHNSRQNAHEFAKTYELTDAVVAIHLHAPPTTLAAPPGETLTIWVNRYRDVNGDKYIAYYDSLKEADTEAIPARLGPAFAVVIPFPPREEAVKSKANKDLLVELDRILSITPAWRAHNELAALRDELAK